MLIDESREKQIEAIKYFVANTKHCGFVKLFKLLYFLDHEHFLQTGRTVTNLSYYAYPQGPVPQELHEQLKSGRGDVADHFHVEPSSEISDEYEPPTIASEPNPNWTPKRKRLPTSIRPRTKYTHERLTRREMQIAERLVEIFREATADDMSRVSHHRGGPWERAYSQDPRRLIDFRVGRPERGLPEHLPTELLEEQIAEHEEAIKALT